MIHVLRMIAGLSIVAVIFAMVVFPAFGEIIALLFFAVCVGGLAYALGTVIVESLSPTFSAAIRECRKWLQKLAQRASDTKKASD